MGRPNVYQNHRRKLNRLAKQSIILTWSVSFGLGLLTTLKIIPGDEYQVHSMGMTLSKSFDQYHLYQILVFMSVAFLWAVYAKSYFSVKKNNRASLAHTSTENHPKFQMLRIEMHIILSCTLCYFPLLIVQSFREISSFQLQNLEEFSITGNSFWNFGIYVASRLIVANSLINCVIYNYHNKYVRRELPNFCSKQKTREENLGNKGTAV